MVSQLNSLDTWRDSNIVSHSWTVNKFNPGVSGALPLTYLSHKLKFCKSFYTNLQTNKIVKENIFRRPMQSECDDACFRKIIYFLL
jgi:hypothetical protein